MAVNMITRQVQGPEKDWLTEGEVLTLLGISFSTLKRYIAAGEFPAGILFGRDRQWQWKDIHFFYLQKELSPRLASRQAAAVDPEVDGDEDDEPIPGSLAAHSRTKAGSQK